MTAFIFRRILLAIPTVFIVLIVCFLLSKRVPGDEVEIFNGNNIEGSGSLQTNPLAFEDSYKKSCLKIGLNKALFYWSLVTMAHPDTLDRILLLPEKKLALSYLERCGNWPLVQSYFDKIAQLQIEFNNMPPEGKILKLKLLSYLTSLKISPEAANQADLYKALRDLKQAGPIRLQLASLEAIRAKIDTTEPGISLLLPKLIWNGNNNQFHHWISSLLGVGQNISLIDGRSVGVKIAEAIKWTLSINLLALAFSVWISIYLGRYLAAIKGSRTERYLSSCLFSIYTLPGFWIGSLCIIFLTNNEYANWLNLFPAGGVGDPDSSGSLLGNLIDLLYHFILPVFCLAYPVIAYLTAHVRDGITDVRKEAYFTTAVAKGLSIRQAIWSHGLKNALFPLISLMGGILPSLISGSVIIEVLFNIPGMGRLMYNGILGRDWPLVFQVVLITAGIVILTQLMVDIMYRLFDPRVKLSK